MKTVAIYGYYGHHNFGDDTMLEGLRQLFKGWQVFPVTSDSTSDYPKINFDSVNNCDLFVLGGGELINQQSLFSKNSIFHSSWAGKIKIPKAILGCGVNAENANQLRRSVVKDLSKFTYIGLRDYKSISILKALRQFRNGGLNLHLFHDPSFSIDTAGLMSRDNPTNTAIVIPTDRFDTKHDAGIQKINTCIDSPKWLIEQLKPYSSVKFLAFGQQDNDDYFTCRYLAKMFAIPRSGTHFDCLIIPYHELSIPKVLNLLSECAISLPYRLHGLILSYIAGTKYEFYPYHRKLQRVQDTISGQLLSDIRLAQKLQFNKMLEATGLG